MRFSSRFPTLSATNGSPGLIGCGTVIRTWQIGDKIKDRWEIRKMFRGGMGVVYVAYDHEWQMLVAAKTFLEEVITYRAKLAQRFEQEALAWVNLGEHPNVVRALLVQVLEGRPVLFLEYVSGGDLTQWIGTPRLIEDLPQVLRFAVQFCDGMEHILDRGIVAHRDIKPNNTLVTANGILKITDFGLSKIFQETEAGESPGFKPGGVSPSLSVTGQGAGTCAYMAPEQFENAKHVDVRADIYSFGVMLYQMITGTLPFAGASFTDFYQLHHHAPIPQVKFRPSIPAAIGDELNGLINTCLSKRPAERIGSFAFLRQKLSWVHRQLTGEDVAPLPIALDQLGWARRGANLAILGHNDEALLACDAALAQDIENASAWTSKGNILATLDRAEEALNCYARALRIAPADETILTNRANVLTRLRRFEEALSAYNQALRNNPRHELAWTGKGEVLLRLERHQKALDCFEEALSLDSRNEQTMVNKASALLALGRSDEALKTIDASLEINPRNAKAWFNKGCILMAMGRSEGALTCLNKSLEIDPDFADAWYNKGWLLDELGQKPEALNCFNETLRIDPQNAEALTGKGRALFAARQNMEALACYDAALRLNRQCQPAWFNKGCVLAAMRLFQEALPCFEESLRLGNQIAHQGIELCRKNLASRS